MIIDIIEFSQNYIVLFLISMLFLDAFDPRPKYFKWDYDNSSLYVKSVGLRLYMMKRDRYFTETSFELHTTLNGFYENLVDVFFYRYLISIACIFYKKDWFYHRISEKELFCDLL